MNPQERDITTVTSVAPAPASRWSRRRTISVVVAGVFVLGAIAYAGYRHVYGCENCGRSPILCDDPCTLPTFG